MTEEQKIVLDLLGQTLFGVPFDPAKYNNIDWSAVLSEARRQTVIPTTVEAVPKEAPKEIRLRWIREAYSAEVNGYRILRAHEDIAEILSAAQIPFVILKGAASGAYYPSMRQRCYGDVDFLIPSDRKPETIDLLEHHGFLSGKDLSGETSLYKDGISYDLHVSVSGIPDSDCGKSIRNCFLNIFDRSFESDLNGSRIMFPDELHHGMVLLLHTAMHLTGFGAGLRQLCDWAVFADSMGDRFDSVFQRALKDAGLWKFAQVMTGSCVRYLHMKRYDWIGESEMDPELINEFMDDIMRKGSLIHDGSDDMDSVFIKETNSGGLAGGNLFLQAIRNLAAKAIYQWPVIGKVKILLPFGMLVMCIRYMFGVLTGSYKKINMKETIARANERRMLYNKLDLFNH